MKRDHTIPTITAPKKLTLSILVFGLFFLSTFVCNVTLSTVSAAVFSVNSTIDATDAAPGDGACATAAGQCTLRAAIQETNASAGADTINIAPGIYNLTLAGSGENASATGDFDITDDVTINGGNIAVIDDVVIDAGGATGTFRDRVFHILGGANRGITVRLIGMTIQNGYLSFGGNGGGAICNHCENGDTNGSMFLPALGISNVRLTNNFADSAGAGISNHGTLTIDNSDISGNFTSYGNPQTGVTGFGGGMGGGLMNWGGTISIVRTVLSNNYAQTGGGIYNQDTFEGGIVMLLESLVMDNVAAMGGGVYNVAMGDFNFPARLAGTVGLTINRTTLANNAAQIDGGGIYNLGIGTVVLLNSTVTLNRAGGMPGVATFPGRGGGIYNGGRILDVLNSTIAGNESAATRVTAATSDGSRGGDEIFFNTSNAGGDPATTIPMVVKLQNTIVGDGVGVDDNCNGATGYNSMLAASINNLDSGTTCGLVVANNLNTRDPVLGPLDDNGGPTYTRAVSTGSPAIGAGRNCPSVDQRNAQRDLNCDLGAVEAGIAAPPVAPIPSPTPVPPTQPPPTQPPPTTPPVNPPPVTPPPVVPPPPVTPPPNTAPVARNGTVTVTAGQTALGALVAVDNDRDPLTFRIVGMPSQGTLILTNATTGAFSFAANANAGGTTDSFTFVANDGQLDSSVATVNITINSAPVANTPPVAAPGQLSLAAGSTATGSLVANDINGNPLTYRITRQASQGVATLASNVGGYSFVANTAAQGSDSFDFVANDGTADSNVATVSITYIVSNTPPSAGDGTLNVVAGASATGSLVASDRDPNTTLSFAVMSQPSKGSVQVTNAASGAYSYTASAAASGIDSFTFVASDGAMESNPATVTVTITNANAPPSAGDGTLNVITGVSTVGRLSAGDVDGDALQFSIVSLPTQGSVTLQNPSTGIFQYSATSTASGIDQFTFRASDGSAISNLGTVSVSVFPPSASGPGVVNNAAPQVSNLSVVAGGTTVTGLLAATDKEGDALTFSVVKDVVNGSLSISSTTGRFTYRAKANAGAISAVDSFTYQASDSTSSSNTGVVKIAVDDTAVTGGATTPRADAGGGAAINPGTTTSGKAGQGGGGATPLTMIAALLALLILNRRRGVRTCS